MSEPAPPRFPSHALMLTVTLVPWCVGDLVFAAMVVLDPSARSAAREILLAIAPAWLASGALLLAGAVALNRPLQRLRCALAAGTPPNELDVADVRAALAHEWWSGALNAVCFALSAGWTVALAWNDGLDAGRRLLATIGVFSGSMIVGAFGLLGGARARLRWTAPALLPDGSLRRLEPFTMTRMWHYLVIQSFVLGVALPGYLVAALVADVEGISLIVFLAADFLLVGVFLTWFILHATSGPLGKIRTGMSKVRTGDLDVQIPVLGLDTLGVVASEFNAMVVGLRQREQMRDVFGRYVNPQVAEEILGGRVQLGGEVRTATVLFADIRSFTTISESMSAVEVVAFLNRYLGGVVRCVLDNGGIVDKFLGDGVMAVFGAPVSHGSPLADAEHAVRCAVAMSRWVDELNREHAAVGLPAFDIGIGMHTGELVAGAIGSAERMEYTVIGDTVNVAARIEGLTKDLGRRLLLSEATAVLLDHRVPLEQLDTHPVKGRAQPVRLYGVRHESSPPVAAAPRSA